jgi:pimeloyl-ACP methyl ester carboxylesterase
MTLRPVGVNMATGGIAMIGHFIHGHGPERALVLHGWFGDSRVYEPMLTALDESRFSLAFMDHRGYGQSKQLGGPFNIATIASDAVALADHLGWNTFNLVGHSMGGKAALRLAADCMQRVRKVLAITPVWAGRVPFDDRALAMFRGAVQDVRLREAIIGDTAGGREPAVWARNLAAQSVRVSLQEAFGGYLESWALSDFAANVHGLPMPTRVVVGAHDSSITRDVVSVTWLANLPKASLDVLPECGHYPMLQTPLALARVFESFLLNDAGEAT